MSGLSKFPDPRRVLIANRGEIAVRIARTAHRLGVGTVGVYSEHDANALHVDSVDVAVALGGNTPAESYLRGDAMVEVAKAHGCGAVHPGYGFLAENADFAQLVIDNGLLWVGPTPEQIALLGDKVAAKRAAVAAGVPTTPVVEVVDGQVPEVSFPALVKAAAGGGGRGMRVVRSAAELPEAIEASAREAKAAFGDGTVFIEPYIERARHVEVQIMGDAFGNVVHLGERECSVQRRNQKVVEEAPSAGITDEVRAVLCQSAVALAQHVGYQNAGTVEFLVDFGGDDAGRITFLEVNTRLQVEHPVTEAVTGLDLVELQLRVAAGEPLPLRQEDVNLNGHAIEVRVVAEDPAAGWLPSVGTVTNFVVPEAEGVRVDTGFRAGSEVSPHYDSLLAKVIGHGPTRAEAAARLYRTLRGSEVSGVRTNIASLVNVLSEADFLTAATPTAYLDKHPEVTVGGGPTGDDQLALLLGAVFAAAARDRRANAATGFAPSGFRLLRTQGQREVWELEGLAHHVEHAICGDEAEVFVGPWPEPGDDGVLGDDQRRRATVRILSSEAVTGADGRGPGATGRVGSEVGRRLALELDGVRRVIDVRLDGDRAFTSTRTGSLEWTRPPRFAVHGAEVLGAGPVSPLPGTVIAVDVVAGQAVATGDRLLVVEAMKMEHTIAAPTDAVVAEVLVAVGDRVDAGQLLIGLEQSEA